MPHTTIGGRLAKHLSLLTLGILIAVLSLTAWLVDRMVGELRPSILSAFGETQTLNEKNVLLNSAGYLGERLRPGLEQSDVAALDREIDQIRGWLPIQSFLVADADKHILTDGSTADSRRGQSLSIPAELLPQQPLIFALPGGSELYFIIGSGDQVVGYAVVTLSGAALQTSLRLLDDQLADLWERSRRSLILIYAATIAVIGLLAAFVIWRLSRSISRPITEMIDAADTYANGNLDVALPVRSDDEIGRLAMSLNTMAQELKVSHRRMRHLANYDSLTGLPNRNLFHDRLRHALLTADRQGHQLGLLFLDLDGFKTVNDSLGHSLGDELLKLVAVRLRETVRASDTVARLGGDEFTVIAEGQRDRQDVEALSLKLLLALGQPYRVQEHRLQLSASVGITLYPKDGATPEILLRNADTAMYMAKRQGKNAYRFFAPELDEHFGERALLELTLRQAVERREFTLHYQPQVNAVSGTLVGVEALLRWPSADQDLQPADFIPLLEDSGLITQLTAWILAESFRTLAQWHAEGLAGLRLAVNLSTLQLEQSDLVQTIRELLSEAGLSPASIEIEITEGTLLNADRGRLIAEHLGQLGVRLAIDDFGTGYSSLVHLRRYSVDTLKIDRCFVRDIDADRDSALITAAVIALARRLEIATVAKGIETQEQWRTLRAQGCDMIQGYFICPPLPADRFLEWARDQVSFAPDGQRSGQILQETAAVSSAQ